MTLVLIKFQVLGVYLLLQAQGPFHVKPKAHTEKEEMSEDERRRSKLPGDVAKDNPVLGKPRSRKEKVARCQRQPPKASQGKAQVQ